MRKPDPATRAIFQRHGWPDPGKAYVYTLRQIALRYALALTLGVLIGGPAAAIVILRNYC